MFRKHYKEKHITLFICENQTRQINVFLQATYRALFSYREKVESLVISNFFQEKTTAITRVLAFCWLGGICFVTYVSSCLRPKSH